MSVYDVTAGEVMTPTGPGKFVHFDAARKKVLVEHDYTQIVEHDAEDVYVGGVEGAGD